MLQTCLLNRDRCVEHLASFLTEKLLKECSEFTDEIREGRHLKYFRIEKN